MKTNARTTFSETPYGYEMRDSQSRIRVFFLHDSIWLLAATYGHSVTPIVVNASDCTQLSWMIQ